MNGHRMIVLPDADLDMAADAAVSAAYGSAGERCMAVSMLVAVGEVGLLGEQTGRDGPADAGASARDGDNFHIGPLYSSLRFLPALLNTSFLDRVKLNTRPSSTENVHPASCCAVIENRAV